ncbi:hypothetical protein K9L05_03025 [Candidatus Babeliales bacterium]|nr:hypothetical protein [Candidatus Babeliales bacterium]MCF7899595.1 hypothetical protein [Candidatus Babeliales bacterium]
MKNLNKVFLAIILGFFTVSGNVLAMEDQVLPNGQDQSIKVVDVDLSEALGHVGVSSPANTTMIISPSSDLNAEKQRHLDVLVNLAKRIAELKKMQKEDNLSDKLRILDPNLAVMEFIPGSTDRLVAGDDEAFINRTAWFLQRLL